VTSSVYWIIF